jgi:hypothetical protein
MKLFNELLGFAVLTGSLWLILVLLPLFLWLAIKLAKRFKRRSTKLAGGVGIFLLGFTVLFGDEIAGGIYLNYLCNTEAGVKVYQTVELPAEYWDENGKPKFYDDKNGNFTLEGYRVDYETGVYSSFFHVDNAGYKRAEVRSGQVLGEVTDFRHWGGWIKRNFNPAGPSANSCENRKEHSNNLIKKIFTQKKS